MKSAAPESYSDYIQWTSGVEELETVPPAYPFRAIMINYQQGATAYNMASLGAIDIEYITNSGETKVIQVSPVINLPSGPFIRSRLFNISGKEILSITANNVPVAVGIIFTLLM